MQVNPDRAPQYLLNKRDRVIAQYDSASDSTVDPNDPDPADSQQGTKQIGVAFQIMDGLHGGMCTVSGSGPCAADTLINRKRTDVSTSRRRSGTTQFISLAALLAQAQEVIDPDLVFVDAYSLRAIVVNHCTGRAQ